MLATGKSGCESLLILLVMQFLSVIFAQRCQHCFCHGSNYNKRWYNNVVMKSVVRPIKLFVSYGIV